MIGVEFVRDRRSRLAWGDGARSMRSALLARGVLMHTCGAWDQVLRFMAPLTIEDELLERGVAAFEESLESLATTPVTRPAGGPVHYPAGPGEPHPLPEHMVPTPGVPPIPGPRLPVEHVDTDD